MYRDPPTCGVDPSSPERRRGGSQGRTEAEQGPADPAGLGRYIVMKYRFWTMNNNVWTMKNCILITKTNGNHQNQAKLRMQKSRSPKTGQRNSYRYEKYLKIFALHL